MKHNRRQTNHDEVMRYFDRQADWWIASRCIVAVSLDVMPTIGFYCREPRQWEWLR